MSCADDAPGDPQREAPGTPADRPATAEVDAERAMRTCPVCGHELAERKCKLYCPRPGCGYFLSCADFY
jgi:hypothetical protein